MFQHTSKSNSNLHHDLTNIYTISFPLEFEEILQIHRERFVVQLYCSPSCAMTWKNTYLVFVYPFYSFGIRTVLFPFMMVLGLHSSSQSFTDLIRLVLKSSTKHHRWSAPEAGGWLQIGQGILTFYCRGRLTSVDAHESVLNRTPQKVQSILIT